MPESTPETNPTMVSKISKHEMTPRARKAIRMGLELLLAKWRSATKPLGSLDDSGPEESAKKAQDYIGSVELEFSEPGSQEEVEKDQAHLFGEEGPFRKDLYDMKGRPE